MKFDDEICKGISCTECPFNKWEDGCLLAKRLDEIEIIPEPCKGCHCRQHTGEKVNDMRLIDVDSLLETMENFLTKAEDEARYAGRRDVEVTWNDAVYMIKTAPTIEPERKKGRWNWVGFNIECTECGFMPIFDSTEPLYKYCPNCGADMRGGDDDK